jgi:ribosomal protein S18 acetylase RimI-like enzyme
MTYIDGPLTSTAGLDELEPLFKQLHSHHLKVATYQPLVADLDESWSFRRSWYQQLLADGAQYFIARNGSGAAAGYGLLSITSGSDDTFVVRRGIAEIMSLVVHEAYRGRGIGQQLMIAMESHADGMGADVLKVAVMSGNRSAEKFYADLGLMPGEQVLYRPVRTQW